MDASQLIEQTGRELADRVTFGFCGSEPHEVTAEAQKILGEYEDWEIRNVDFYSMFIGAVVWAALYTVRERTEEGLYDG